MPGYVELPDRIICWSERSGSQVIKRALDAGAQIRREAAIKSRKAKHLYIRHPLERLASCFERFGVEGHTFPGAEMPATMAEFVDEVLSGRMNVHWAPQMTQHRGLSPIVRRIENIDDTWPSGFPRQGAERKTRPRIDHRRAELLAFYAEDISAWQADA